MESYGQLQIQQGDVISAMVESGVLDGLISDTQKKKVLQIASQPRDLLCDLQSIHPHCSNGLYDSVRKAESTDQDRFLGWIHRQFGERWMIQVLNSF